eukprot:GCRY01003671.1.p1 GENE.GCRY01003671.1~~GCRY01003671.1.p1  ORF type:complete len:140 (-),score=9.45 GCRY01003671.1:79-498(-)
MILNVHVNPQHTGEQRHRGSAQLALCRLSSAVAITAPSPSNFVDQGHTATAALKANQTTHTFTNTYHVRINAKKKKQKPHRDKHKHAQLKNSKSKLVLAKTKAFKGNAVRTKAILPIIATNRNNVYSYAGAVVSAVLYC